MQDIPICKICKEPINNFVCIEPLSQDIVAWLPPGLSKRFAWFNNWFLDTFDYGHYSGPDRHHMVCGNRGKGSVCLYCYVNEVFQWLWGQDRAVARRFRKLFSFGMKKTDFREITLSHAEPISEVKNMEDEFGICDECGEYAEELRVVNGRWICSECSSE